MEGTDIQTGNVDGNFSHDHTYYGNGCSDRWVGDGSGGSTTACSTDLATTADNEDQKMGVYYTYQAASSGSGAATSTDNTNIPDTFCPFGWQLPYAGTGGDYYDKSKSWKYLFVQYGLGNNVDSYHKFQSYPFSYVYTGLYHWAYGKLYAFSYGGFVVYWSGTVSGSGNAYRINAISLNESPGKTNGHMLRCEFIRQFQQ